MPATPRRTLKWGRCWTGCSASRTRRRSSQRAVELAPSDAAAHYRLARDYDRIGKHEAAQAEREKHAQLVKAQEPIR